MTREEQIQAVVGINPLQLSLQGLHERGLEVEDVADLVIDRVLLPTYQAHHRELEDIFHQRIADRRLERAFLAQTQSNERLILALGRIETRLSQPPSVPQAAPAVAPKPVAPRPVATRPPAK